MQSCCPWGHRNPSVQCHTRYNTTATDVFSNSLQQLTKAGDTQANTVRRHWWPTMLAVIFVGPHCRPTCLLVSWQPTSAKFSTMLFSFDSRQRWLACRGSRQCRPTNLTFNFTYLLFFWRFSQQSCGILLWNFPHLSLGVVLSSHESNVIDFSCTIFASNHVNAMTSHKTYIYIYEYI